MSKWTVVNYEDLELDGDSINILHDTDLAGNNYVEVRLKDIFKLLAQSKLVLGMGDTDE